MELETKHKIIFGIALVLVDFGSFCFCSSYFAVFLIIAADLLINLYVLQKNQTFLLDNACK